MREPPKPVRRLPQPRIAVIAFERIAAGGDEIDDRVEIGAPQMAIGRGRAHFREQRVGIERRRHAMPSTCCASTSRPPLLQALAIQFACQHRVARGIAFQHFEAVGRHQQRRAGSSSR